MHHANHFYGHAHIMARYVGLEHPPRIWGYLQHGWNMHDGFAVGTVFARGYPKFVWSQACARRGWAAGLRDYMVVGSAWLYLLDLERQREWSENAPAREGTIVYPFHGWEGQQVRGSHAAYIEQVRSTEGDVPITVCLHWNEYDNPKVRHEYEDAGVRVISHGQRGYLWQDTDVAFLYRQLREIRSHRRVVSNRMSSAILYGATAGAEVGIYGDPMELESDHAVLGGVGKPRRLWPDMHQVEVPGDYALEVSNAELGADTLLLPEEIIDIFGWAPDIEAPTTPPPAPPLEEYVSWHGGSGARHRANSHSGPADAEPAGNIGVTANLSHDGLDTHETRDTHDTQEGPAAGEVRERSRDDGRSETPSPIVPDSPPVELVPEAFGVGDAL